jgi:hypothetical protein
VNAKNQFSYSPASATTAAVDVKPLQGTDISVSTQSGANGAGCAAIGVKTGAASSGYMSMSATTSGSRATIHMWSSSSYFVFIGDYQSGDNITGYNLSGTFKENVSGLSGTATLSSFRYTSWGSYIGFITATASNCTLTSAIG